MWNVCYIGQTGRPVNTYLKEHMANCEHKRIGKSAPPERLNQPCYNKFWRGSKVPVKEQKYRKLIVREAIKMEKHDTFNKEDGFRLPGSWKPALLMNKKISEDTSKFCSGIKLAEELTDQSAITSADNNLTNQNQEKRL